MSNSIYKIFDVDIANGTTETGTMKRIEMPEKLKDFAEEIWLVKNPGFSAKYKIILKPEYHKSQARFNSLTENQIKPEMLGFLIRKLQKGT